MLSIKPQTNDTTATTHLCATTRLPISSRSSRTP